jgi:hypothetical protein
VSFGDAGQGQHWRKALRFERDLKRDLRFSILDKCFGVLGCTWV